MRKFSIILNIVINLMLMSQVDAAAIPFNPIYDSNPYSIAYYHGQTVKNSLFGILIGKTNRWPEKIDTLEFAYTLSPENTLRQFFYPIVGVVQIAGNITLRDRHHIKKPIYELDPYLIFRFTSFPWNDYVRTSFAIGEGMSYVTSVPSLERKANESTKRLLNFLMLEATFAHPRHPQVEFLIRIHHRSGAFGLYQAGNTGSNDLALGLRYLFD